MLHVPDAGGRYYKDTVTTIHGTVLLASATEQLEEEQKDVEDVEEDARRDGHGASRVRSAQAVEIKDGEPAENRQPGHRVDQMCVRDRDEDQDDPEHDETE